MGVRVTNPGARPPRFTPQLCHLAALCLSFLACDMGSSSLLAPRAVEILDTSPGRHQGLASACTQVPFKKWAGAVHASFSFLTGFVEGKFSELSAVSGRINTFHVWLAAWLGGDGRHGSIVFLHPVMPCPSLSFFFRRLF